MRINMRESERTLQVDVRVPIKAREPLGSVLPSLNVVSKYTPSVSIADTVFPTLQDKTRTTLTMEDLSAALSEYGINSRKPEFYL